MRVAYFGPADGPVRDAVARLADGLGGELERVNDVAAAVRAVEDGAAERAAVPLEDDHSGSHRTTVDALVFASSSTKVVEVLSVEDGQGRQVQIALLSTDDVQHARAGRTLLFCVPRRNRPGTLSALLSPLAARGLNLTKLESRPLGGRLGEYGFVVEVDAGLAEPALLDALEELVTDDIAVKVLGAYEPPLGQLGRVDERPLPGEVLESLDDVARLRARP